YLPLLQKAISGAPASNSSDLTIAYTWLGKYSINMVKPANTKKNKTLKHMNPNNSMLTKNVLDEFLQHQQTVSALLVKAQKAELNRKTIPIEFMRFLKMKTGETCEFVVVHQERHIGQAQRVKAKLPKGTDAILVV
ncbi:MAG: DinB family protein, partial [Chitinophagaceae bacterium]